MLTVAQRNIKTEILSGASNFTQLRE